LIAMPESNNTHLLLAGAEPGFEYRGAIDKTNWTTDKEK
jgi:hypothetical protein